MVRNRKRGTAVVRNVTSSATILAAGVVRNVAAGMLPLTTTPKVRLQLAQHVSAMTIAKAITAGRAGDVRRRPHGGHRHRRQRQSPLMPANMNVSVTLRLVDQFTQNVRAFQQQFQQLTRGVQEFNRAIGGTVTISRKVSRMCARL
jgi:hypothetical protein